ncbi:hypothetical protein AAMO2058_001291100 [Amorphochlora amoebiformis]
MGRNSTALIRFLRRVNEFRRRVMSRRFEFTPEPSSPVVTVSEDLVATGGHEFQEPINWIAFICALLAFIVAIIQACYVTKIPDKRVIHSLNVLTGVLLIASLPIQYVFSFKYQHHFIKVNTTFQTLLVMSFIYTGLKLTKRAYEVYAQAVAIRRGFPVSFGLSPAISLLSTLFLSLEMLILVWTLNFWCNPSDESCKETNWNYTFARTVKIGVRALAALSIGVGIVLFMCLNIRVLVRARQAVIAAGPSLGGEHSRSSLRLAQSTSYLQRNLCILATYAVVVWILVLAALVVALKWKSSVHLYTIGSMVVYPFFIYAAWHRTPCSADPEERIYEDDSISESSVMEEKETEELEERYTLSFQYDSFRRDRPIDVRRMHQGHPAQR